MRLQLQTYTLYTTTQLLGSAMYKQFSRQTWTCARCLRKLSRLENHRRNSTTAGVAIARAQDESLTSKDFAPYWIGEENVAHQQDDRALRDVFDSQDFWQSFIRNAPSRSPGLVQNHYIKKPDGFQKFAIATLEKCKHIVQRTLAASTLEEYISMARDLDRLSDLLCRVIDLSDFIRASHPDPAYVNAANRAYAAMFEYMNELNTTSGLNEQLKTAFSMSEVVSEWSGEEKTVARILMKEFANSAIDLPETERRRFVELSNDIAEVGTAFVNGIEPAEPVLTFDATKLNGVDPTMVQSSRKWNGKVAVSTYSYEAHKLLNFANDEEVRRTVHTAQRTSSQKQVHRLETLLRKRAELADLSGHQSFAHMTLSDKMAKSPEAVGRFLTTLNSTNRPTVEAELSRLLNASSPADVIGKLAPWDYAYKLRQLEQSSPEIRTSKSRHLGRLSSFFSLGTVMQGISRLFTRLYGVRLVPRETPHGETWSDNVRRLDVIHETEGPLAVIYCDLFSRVNKSPNPAHFTLRCSREITDSEISEYPDDLPNDGMPITTGISRITNQKAPFQLPVIALVCDFPHPTSTTPSLLSLHNVITLFHEMGHAIHSILGRTSLQSISGTRCATDFAELPSVLMESFATDPTVLSLYARHWETGQPLTPEMVTALLKQNALQSSLAGAMANETQILMSFLDQAYHSLSTSSSSSSSFNSTAIYHETYTRHSSLAPEPRTTSWQGSFSHLYGYGATYYSYLFDRAIARKVWHATFGSGRDGGAVDRRAGELFKEKVLKWGGGRDPWVCLEELVGGGEGVLAEGQEGAMKRVGEWGVGVGEGDAVGL